MARDQPVVHKWPTMLKGPVAHKPRWVCVSVRLKVVAILYEVAC
jgi:hypothetical protein